MAYNVTYLITGSYEVLNKTCETFEEAMAFASKVTTGNVLEIKRVEDAS